MGWLQDRTLIGVACDLGGPVRGSAEGPQVLQQAGIQRALTTPAHQAHWLGILHPPVLPRLAALQALYREIALRVGSVCRAGQQAWVLGGDHAIAHGTWRGVAHAYRQPLGLLWIDAHLDAHTPQTSESGNPHGMPLAALLGQHSTGDEWQEGAALDPARVCVLGARSWEAAELDCLQELGVRIYTAEEILERGVCAVLAEALERVVPVELGPDALFGITLDLDALDPRQVPAVDTPVNDGIDPGLLMQALRGVAKDPRCVAVELTEYDPLKDLNFKTRDLVSDLIVNFVND